MIELQPGRAQAIYQLPVARLKEKLVDALRYLRAHFLGLLQRLRVGVSDGVEAAESFRQQDGRPDTDKADPQSDQHARQRILPRFFDVAKHVLRGLLAHPLKVDKLLEREAINVGHALDQPPVDQLIDQRVAHAVDIHHRAGGEVQDRFLEPRRTVGIDAAGGGFILFTDDVASANRTLLRHVERTPRVALLDDAHDSGNHVAAALDQHFVADLDAQPSDFVLIVKRGPRHRDAADRHRPQVRDRRQCARPGHLYVDVLDHRGRLSRGVLVGDGPARRFGCPAELPLRRNGIDFHDDAVDFVRQALALGLPLGAEGQHFVHAVA